MSNSLRAWMSAWGAAKSIASAGPASMVLNASVERKCLRMTAMLLRSSDGNNAHRSQKCRLRSHRRCGRRGYKRCRGGRRDVSGKRLGQHVALIASIGAQDYELVHL